MIVRLTHARQEPLASLKAVELNSEKPSGEALVEVAHQPLNHRPGRLRPREGWHVREGMPGLSARIRQVIELHACARLPNDVAAPRGRPVRVEEWPDGWVEQSCSGVLKNAIEERRRPIIERSVR